jgi:hypothetical protein
LFQAIDLSGSGDHVVVPGIAGYAVRVRKWFVKAGATGLTVRWKDESGASLTGALPLAAYDGIGEGEVSGGLMQTGKGRGLVLNLSDAQAVGGKVVFEYVN